ncbi:uncharacterized protein LOC106515224 [Austrofundulus limnaeus]|uniref:Uncharacterized protein LOC106515224 n=1 Tax=Austrofundulus limnaeus TaxID=52670 RepID=A0A2I4AXZ5_AUSLI|nr:PREDICTED: uncharacterized protein LOC106515224 [Austrofundulus limnaeus]
MPQTGLSFEDGPNGPHYNTWKVSHVKNEHIPGRSWVNGAFFQHGCSAASRTSESSPVGSLDLPKLPGIVNVHVDHRLKARRPKAAPLIKIWTRESQISPVSNGSGAGMTGTAPVLGGGAARPGAGSPDCKSEQVVPDPSSSKPKKNQRRKMKFRNKKKREDEVSSSGCSAPPEQEQEDWEAEIQEVTLGNWEKMCFGVSAYGPEDVIQFALRDLSLQPNDDLPATANYSPAVHHMHPIHWRAYKAPAEPDQFTDAEE